jgi:hypothetical protein
MDDFETVFSSTIYIILILYPDQSRSKQGGRRTLFVALSDLLGHANKLPLSQRWARYDPPTAMLLRASGVDIWLKIAFHMYFCTFPYAAIMYYNNYNRSCSIGSPCKRLDILDAACMLARDRPPVRPWAERPHAAQVQYD